MLPLAAGFPFCSLATPLQLHNNISNPVPLVAFTDSHFPLVTIAQSQGNFHPFLSLSPAPARPPPPRRLSVFHFLATSVAAGPLLSVSRWHLL
jgi:hypothetical protein